MASGRLIAVGDVHGCIHALDAVLDAIAPARNDELVFLGDMVDHGRNSKEVLDRILELQRQCRVVLIQGNHEELMLRARESEQDFSYWQNCGGATTLSSYNFPGRLTDVPDSHWELMQSCRPYYETDQFIFSHANYLPEAPMSEQPPYELRWALFEPTEQRPHSSGKPVLVGHTEQREGEVLDLGFAACIDTACWRYGWLTAIEPSTGDVWQASKWGVMRDKGEATHREALSELIGGKIH
jgi:serine/threonine protein phosphatase 1